jgi:hypothetical protein
MCTQQLDKRRARQSADRDGDSCNTRVGNFVSTTQGVTESSWCLYQDIYGNTIVYGAPGGATDVIVTILPEHRAQYEPLIYAYLRALVGRHGEVLEEVDCKVYRAVTVRLPIGYAPTAGPCEVTIHTGSGCDYDQDEIAYEVMAALSEIPVYTALAPAHYCYDFVRVDTAPDRVSYMHHGAQISITFTVDTDDSSVVVQKRVSYHDTHDGMFAAHMYELVDTWVRTFSPGRCTPGVVRLEWNSTSVYPIAQHALSGTQDTIAVSFMADAEHITVAMQVPYFSHIQFGRLAYAKAVMEHMSRVFERAQISGTPRV